MRTAVQFGAGNIGRGFMGQLFGKGGLQTIFVDANRSLVGQLNRARSYPLRLLDAYAPREVDLVIEQSTALAADQTHEVAAALARGCCRHRCWREEPEGRRTPFSPKFGRRNGVFYVLSHLGRGD